MSELKRCPLCNSEFELDKDKRFYIHPLVGCYFDCLIIKADNENSIKKWNTRKPMGRIVERLKKELLESLNKANDEMIDNGHTLDFEHYFGEKESYEKAIEIVKEEGGMNER